MPLLLGIIDEQGNDVGKTGDVKFPPIANIFHLPDCQSRLLARQLHRLRPVDAGSLSERGVWGDYGPVRRHAR